MPHVESRLPPSKLFTIAIPIPQTQQHSGKFAGNCADLDSNPRGSWFHQSLPFTLVTDRFSISCSTVAWGYRLCDKHKHSHLYPVYPTYPTYPNLLHVSGAQEALFRLLDTTMPDGLVLLLQQLSPCSIPISWILFGITPSKDSDIQAPQKAETRCDEVGIEIARVFRQG